MARLGTLLFAAAFVAACSSTDEPVAPPPVADPAISVTVAQGELVGFADADTGAHVWRSVPFAAPPVGDLRWRAPREPASWDGAREAVEAPPRCVQFVSALSDGDAAGTLSGQEDCLYMDIYAPAASDAREDLPVMLWIHGGSNTWGWADQYDASELASRHNVIVAVMQYRMGPLGWFAHSSLRDAAENADDAAANFGTLDQVAALEWLQANAASFGGDASRVTVFGESAGGHNVVALLASPRASGLFHRAIIQSGSFRSVSLEEAETRDGDSARVIAERLTGEAGASAEALRAVSPAALYGAYDTQVDFDPPRIIQDGVVLPSGPMEEVFASADTFNAVPIITGTNRDETKLFNLLDDRLVKQAWGRFPKARDEALYEGLSEYQSRLWRAGSVDLPARAMTSGGHAPVYAYRFDWDEAGKVFVSDFSKLFGAAHALEIPFVFGRFQFLGDADRFVFTDKNADGRYALSDTMMSYWANFAATGAPGSGVAGDLPEWTPWPADVSAETLMIFDSPADGGWRMVSDVESGARITADLAADPALEGDNRRCTVYAASNRWFGVDGFEAPTEC